MPTLISGSGSGLVGAVAAFRTFAVPAAVQSVKAVASVWERRLTESVFT